MTNKEGVVWIDNLIKDLGDAKHSDLWHYAFALEEIRSLLTEDEDEDDY